MAKITNRNGLNREYGNATPEETAGGGAQVRSGGSRTIGPIKGRYKFSSGAIGAGTEKQAPTGLDRNFGNAVPHELSRDPYKVNKNAR